MPEPQPNPTTPLDSPGTHYRLMSLLSVVIGSSQLLERRLAADQAVSPEQILSTLSTIQRSGWEAARIANTLGLEPPVASDLSGRADEFDDDGQ